jgi:hypothetical protein
VNPAIPDNATTFDADLDGLLSRRNVTATAREKSAKQLIQSHIAIYHFVGMGTEPKLL